MITLTFTEKHGAEITLFFKSIENISIRKSESNSYEKGVRLVINEQLFIVNENYEEVVKKIEESLSKKENF